jgi:predicted dehydrogenase
VKYTRILIAGIGSIGKRHLKIVRESLPDATIMVLRHKHPAEPVEFADFCTSSVEDVIKFRPELAVLANPATFHADLARALLGVGCRLLIEKPLAADVEQAQAIVRDAQEVGIACQVGYNLRFMPSLIEFRRILRSEFVGEILSVRCEVGQHLAGWRPGVDYRQCVSARRELGGGVLLELSHELDYLGWIFGPIEWVNAWTGRQSALEIDVEDTAHLILGFKAPSKVCTVLTMDFIRHDTTRRCVAIGTKGSLFWDALGGVVEVCNAGSSERLELFRQHDDRDVTYRNQWSAFMARPHSLVMPSPQLETVATLEEGLFTLQVVEAARQSASNFGKRSDVIA